MSGTTLLLPPKEHRARKLALFFCALAPVAFGLLAVWLGQDANWDLRNYHWYNAYAFLNGRYEGVDLLPSQTPWFYNPTIDVPFYLLATYVPAVVAGFALGAVQGLNFVFLFMLAYAGLVIPNPRQKVIACATLSALGMLGGGGIALIGTTFYDNVTSLGLFLSALMVIRHRDALFEDPWRKAIVMALLSGIPAGFAMGLKLPCFTFCFALCAAMLFLSGAWHRRFIVAFFLGIGILIGVAITLGHWAWFLQTHFGSPFFPYFNEVFKAPLAPMTSARDTQYVPRSLHDFLLFPFIFTSSPYRAGEIPWRDWRIPILYVLLPAAVLLRLIFGRNRQPSGLAMSPQVARYLMWWAALSYAFWLVMFGIYRYAVPMEMLSPLLIVFAVELLPMRATARALFAAFLLIVVAASVQPGNWSRRAAWLDHFVTADVPLVHDAPQPMLLMAGFEPYSHMVTSFPPEMPVVRIQSNFASPDQGKPINDVLGERIGAHHGKFLLLIPDWQHKVAAEALSAFHLAANWKACQIVTDHLYDESKYDLCPVSRVRE